MPTINSGFTLEADDKKVLIDYYQSHYDGLLNEYEEIKAKLNSLEKKLKSLNAPTNGQSYNALINGYSKDWSWNQKIKYVLNKSGKLSRGGIIDEILKLEPERESERASIANSIGATLSTSVGKESAGYDRVDEGDVWIYFSK